MSTPSIKELRQAHAREGQRSPKWLRLLLIAAGLFLLYVVVGFFVAPPIVRAQLEKRLAAELHRPVSVAKVKLNPLTLSGAIEGFVIREADGKQEFISWRRAFANFDSWSLFAGEWRFDEVVLDGASARVSVGRDGALNFADLLAQFSAAPAKAEDKSELKALSIQRLTVSAARLDYSEDTGPQPFSTVMGPVSFSLRDFHTGGKKTAPGEFLATTEAGENISWRGTLAVAPLRSSGDFSLGQIVLKKYMPYVARFSNVVITDGTLAVKAHYEMLFAGDKPELQLRDGMVALKSFKAGGAGGAEPAVALESMEISGLTVDSKERTASVGRVALAGGRIAATRDTQGIDLLRLLTPKGTAPDARAVAATGPAATPASFDARLGELAVSGLELVLTDTTTPRPARVEVENVSLNVKDVSLAQLAKTSPITLSAGFVGGGGFRIAGSLAPQPLKGDIELELENVPLALVSPYAETFVNLRVAKGSVSTKANVAFDTPAAGGVPAITARADMSIGDFEAIDGDGSGELARWKMLSLRGVEAVTAPALKLLVADIEWTEPSGDVVIGEDGALNLAGLIVPSARSASAGSGKAEPSVSFKTAGGQTAAPAASGAFVAIDRFQLNNAAFTFVDRSMEPDVRLALNQLSGSVSGLSSAAIARADVDLRGKVDGVAPVSIRGQINPLAAEAFTDLKIDFKSVDLRPTGPYVAKFAGYELERGALTLDVRAKLDQRRVDSTTVVTLDSFVLGAGSESADATKLPVKLGLAILRDRNGRIALPPVDVDGRLDDPNFRIGRVVWYAIGNIFAKAATSPFSLIGSMFGGGAKSEELAFQEFLPGTIELTPDSLKKLDVVAKALAERPDLRLDIAGSYGAAVDSPGLRERELAKGIRVALWEEKRRVAMPGAVVPPPEQLEVSPEAEARMIGIFYRAAFEQKEPKQPETPDALAAKASEQSKERTVSSAAPIVRQFRRSGAPIPTTRSAPVPKPPPPRPYGSATPGRDGSNAAATTEAAKVEAPLPTLEEMRARLLAAISVDENVLRELAGERARRVRSHLLEGGQIEAERISLKEESAKGPRVDLQLQLK